MGSVHFPWGWEGYTCPTSCDYSWADQQNQVWAAGDPGFGFVSTARAQAVRLTVGLVQGILSEQKSVGH
jgi:hypothetical protein